MIDQKNFKALSPKEAAKIILKIKKPVIVMHRSPDGDAIGTAKALSCVFSQLGKEYAFACEDEIPENLQFIIGNIQLVKDYKNYTPICVDTASPNQVGEIYQKLGKILLMIDHHSVGEPFTDNYIVKTASSAAEVLMDIIDYLKDNNYIEMNKELAYPLYAAISSDTGCFCYSNVTPKTHIRAAELISTGIDFADINHRLFQSKTESQMKAEAFVAEKIKTASEGKIAYAVITKSERDSKNISKEDLSCAIDVVKTLKGSQIAFTLKESDEGLFKVSLRSTGPDVACVAKTFGGGGHFRAAGCTVDAESIEDALGKILSEIQNQSLKE